MDMRNPVVLSDVHLGEAASVDGDVDGDWLRYRQRRWFPDADFEGMISSLLGRVGNGDELDLVFGGDCIEFDAPRTSLHGSSFEDDGVADEGAAIHTVERVAADHPGFIATIARVAEEGHGVVFVVGNHDAALHFPGVQQALRQAIFSHLAHLAPAALAEVEKRVRVCAWFYQTDDGIHVEHGHQYDTYCSFRDPLRPLDAEGKEIHPTVGSLAFRHLVSRMGYFNAYDERSFMLSVPNYLLHWAKRYLFSKRSLAVRWFIGAIRVVAEVIRHRPERKLMAMMREQAAVTRAAYAQAHGVDVGQADEHARLFVEPADADPHRVLREFRLDHAALAVVGVGGLVTAAFKPKLGLGLALGALAVGIAQELLAPRRPLGDSHKHVDSVARQVAEIYDARAVVFGHTHIPHAEIEDGVFYANTGSWAPTPEAPDLPRPSPKGRPLVWLRRPKDDAAAPLEGGLYHYRDGAVRPDAVLPGAEPPGAAELPESPQPEQALESGS